MSRVLREKGLGVIGEGEGVVEHKEAEEGVAMLEVEDEDAVRLRVVVSLKMRGGMLLILALALMPLSCLLSSSDIENLRFGAVGDMIILTQARCSAVK